MSVRRCCDALRAWVRIGGFRAAAGRCSRTLLRMPRPHQAQAVLWLCCLWLQASASAAPGACQGTVYLTLDTGSMLHADTIADILNRQQVKATFFLANERTVRHDHSLDPSWGPYWKARAAEGHAFGSHTFDHVYTRRDVAGRIEFKPQFGPQAGQTRMVDGEAYCAELNRVQTRFQELTGRSLDPLFRAPGGRTTPLVLAAARRCGYAHVGWAPAGFLGDELPSERYPNDMLLRKALNDIRDGDILMAHLGIWSRKDAFAPMLDPLITGLKARGLCFATLREHPAYRSTSARTGS